MLDPQQLAEVLRGFRQRDPGLRSFGSKTHRFSLNPCLPLEDLTGFEEEAGVTLPDEYRDFLLRYGNGGAGPGYGLMPLADVRREFGGDPLYLIGEPFVPPTSASAMVEDRPYPDAGVLPVAHMGCGHMWVLITAGFDRGTMWGYTAGVDYEPESLESPDYSNASNWDQRIAANNRCCDALLADRSRRLTFGVWYQNWIDEKQRDLPMVSLLSKARSLFIRP